MKIMLINIDSVLPNIALLKIEKYHLDKGDEVIWDFPLLADKCDKVFVSVIFTKNKHLAAQYKGLPNVEIGGTGWDLKTTLPKEISKIKLKINYGFTTRGCIRKCPFCFVPEKEGAIKVTGDLLDIWDGSAKEIVLFDNNITAVPDHLIKICKQAQEKNIRLDFNQGLDIRIINEALIKELKKTKLKAFRFAFDDPKLKPIIKKKIPLLRKYKIQALFYILVGFNSNFEEELSRINYLLENGQRAYVMRHEKCGTDKRYIALSAWCNNPSFGKGTLSFTEYLNNTEKGQMYKKYFKKPVAVEATTGVFS